MRNPLRTYRWSSIACLLGVLLLASDEHASAATVTDALAVSTQINATCNMTVAVDLDFGTVNLASPVPQAGGGTISVTCTNGSPIYVTMGQGLYPAAGSTDTNPIRQMSAGGTDRLDYQIYLDAAYTIPWGNTPLTGAVLSGTGGGMSQGVYALVPAGQQVLSGLYQDSVLATITY